MQSTGSRGVIRFKSGLAFIVAMSLAWCLSLAMGGALTSGCDANAQPRAATATPAATTTSASKEPATMPNVDPADKVTRTEEEWKKILSPEQYNVLRKKGTERSFTGEYDQTFDPGSYVCAACGNELFTSDTKFNSGCGWPAFYAAKAGDRVTIHEDRSFGMIRKEVLCARCGSHLGHIFDDAPDQPTGQRYCINSISLKFIPASAKAPTTGPTTKP